VGRISYSLYLFHYGVLVVMMTLWPGLSFLTVKNMTLYLTSSFVLASLSYFFLERPMVEVRRRLRGSSSRAAAAAPSSSEQAGPSSKESPATLLQR
jgi:peptidoglycan/LPS O-acetylase OafA/YrhL